MKTLSRIICILPFICLISDAAERVCSSPPPEFPGATLGHSTPETARYKCAEGLEPYEGSPVVQCSGGQWGKLTMQCKKKSCGNAGELLNGIFKYDGEPELGAKAYPICNNGFTLKGPTFIQCGITGWPTLLPTCEEGAVTVTCPAPKVANSEMKGVAREYNVDDVLTVKCRPGFQKSGAEQITCGSDGKWQPSPPQCVARPPKTGRCGVPQNTEESNSHLAPKYSAQKSFAAGTKVYYVCDVGYVLDRGSKYRVCSNGQWTRLQLQCKRRLCGSAGDLQNGHFVYTGVEFGDRATAVCDEGFQLVGQATRNCLVRGWDGHIPVCEAMECDDPPEVPNAEILGYAEAPFEYRTVVKYRCLVGRLLGSADIWCTENGTWSSPLPQCKDITCPTPNIPNASWVSSQSGWYQFRDSIYVHCNPRYTLVGPRTITCDENGQWSPELPKCKTSNIYRRG